MSALVPIIEREYRMRRRMISPRRLVLAIVAASVLLTSAAVLGSLILFAPESGQAPLHVAGPFHEPRDPIYIVGNEDFTEENGVTRGSGTASVSEATVTLTATDATTGVAGTEYRIDDGAWTDYSEPFEVTGSGTHTVEFRSTDNAGNIESTKTVEVEIEGGGGVLGFYGWVALLVVLAIIAILVLISVPKMVGMRRKAKEADSRAAVKDIGTSMAQMVDEGPPKGGQEPPPPE